MKLKPFFLLAAFATCAVTAFAPPLPTSGLYVQFDRRGWAAEYYSGTVITNFNTFDPVVGHTVADEVSLQLDAMRLMGVNTINFELRATDPAVGLFEPPACNTHPALGLQYPQPTATEITNLVAFFNRVQTKGVKILLNLVNTHMEEQPPTNNVLWLGTILNTVKDHPALDLVLFNGNTHLVDSNGDGTLDACGIPAEPPLWMGLTAQPAQYVKWAMSYAHSLGLPWRKLSAEAIVGSFLLESQPPSGPAATDGHLWSPIYILKRIFDDLAIPNNQRTYALSFYEHRKCSDAMSLPCTDADPHAWADETFQKIYATIGTNTGARVVAVEMGIATPVVATNWSTEQAFESLIALMYKYGADGGCFWHWINSSDADDQDSSLASPVKKRGELFVYNPIKNLIGKRYTYPVPLISNPRLTGTTFTLSVPTQIGFNYVLEFKNALSNASWTPVQTNGGNDATMTLTNAGVTGSSRLYRVRVQ